MNQKMQTKAGRKTRRALGRAILLFSGGVFAILALANTAAGQATRPTMMMAPSGRANLMTDGVTDGKVQLVMNKTTVITTARPYKSVSIGQPEIADVTPVSPTNILVTAKKPGSTQVIVWDDQNRSQVADVHVTMDLDALHAQLKAMFPGASIEVAAMNGALALKGRVPDLQTAEQAVIAAGSYGVKVMNFLEVGGGQQVMLQVRFAEVSRSATSQLGVNFAMSDGIFSLGSNVGQVTPSGFMDGGPGSLATQSVGSGVTLFGSGQTGAVAFRYFIQALRQNNLLRVLAEPNLIAMSGQEASFMAGGEFPVPVPQSGTGGAATITVEYREFGIRLGFVPVVLGDGRIRLKMTPEVSDLDFSTPIVISGSRIPVVNKRKVTTTVELADGQTFAVAGLLNNNIAAAKDVTPGLGDIPVLGALFRSVRYQRKETELVVLVTPKLVAPMNPGQVSKLPGEHWRNPNEAELFINQDIGGEQDVPVERTPDRAPRASRDAKSEQEDADLEEPGAIMKALAAANPTTNPSTQPTVAQTSTTKPSLTANTTPTTTPVIVATPTTKPALVQAPPTPAPVAIATPATKPAMAQASPAAQPSQTAQPDVAAQATAANPSSTKAPIMPKSPDAGSMASLTGSSTTPRYQGRHGFTPPAHSPPRGLQ